ncbi:MAG: GGDEF domain-containing protein, partial [Alphaproteobacteria bacterium]|nr:GGDEF domain-containing protein [Alphaproteobacteria bacterium]
DIFQRLQAEKKLRENATHDGLTGLLTRATLMQVSEVELLRSRRYGRAWSVIMLDIDHFKAINDHHGHPTGDKVLAGVAEACRNLLRGCDVIGRYGGEEFLAVLPETDAKGALAVAERIRHQVQGCQPAGPSIAVTISAGIAALTASVFDLGTLIGAADRALYRAKRAGRNRVELA